MDGPRLSTVTMRATVAAKMVALLVQPRMFMARPFILSPMILPSLVMNMISSKIDAGSLAELAELWRRRALLQPLL